MHCKKHNAKRNTEKLWYVNVTVKNEDTVLDFIPPKKWFLWMASVTCVKIHSE